MSKSSPLDDGQILRDAGLQVTAQRLAVYRAVRRHPHGAADELCHEVRGEIGAISRQAVYDALHVLSEHGLIRRIQPAGATARYEHQIDNHHHLVCRRCGLMVDTACAVGEAPCLSALHPHGFVIDEAEIIYWGICPSCQSPSVAMSQPSLENSPHVES